MCRSCVVLALLVATVPMLQPAAAAPNQALVTRAEAARHGLVRPWFTQVRLDPGHAQVTHLRFAPQAGSCPATLFVQTNRAVVHAIAAETGETLWVKLVGQPDHVTVALDANDELVSVVNDTMLYVLRRADGKLLWHNRIDGVPAAGVVMSDRRAFVPMVNGQIISYWLEKERVAEDKDLASPTEADDLDKPSDATFDLQQQYIPPLSCLSFGRITSHPIVMGRDELGDYVAWTTTKGLFVGHVDQEKSRSFNLVYQITTAGEVVAPPTFLPPGLGSIRDEGILFAASENGQIFAISARGGGEIWKYSIGEPILQPVVPIGKHVYVVTQLGGLYCLENDTGRCVWWTDKISQFVAASQKRLYVATQSGDLRVLSIDSGALLDTMPAADLPLKYLNLDTDRIFMATASGLVQCFHEVEQTEPLRHREPVEPKAADAAAPEQPVDAQAEPAAAANPFKTDTP